MFKTKFSKGIHLVATLSLSLALIAGGCAQRRPLPEDVDPDRVPAPLTEPGPDTRRIDPDATLPAPGPGTPAPGVPAPNQIAPQDPAPRIPDEVVPGAPRDEIRDDRGMNR